MGILRALFQAILENNLAAVQQLVESDPKVDVNAQLSECYHTANLLISPFSLSPHNFTVIKDREALSVDEEKGPTPLHEAVRLGHYAIAEYLLGCGAKSEAAVTIPIVTANTLIDFRQSGWRYYTWPGVTPLAMAKDQRMAELLLMQDNSDTQTTLLQAFKSLLFPVPFRKGFLKSPVDTTPPILELRTKEDEEAADDWKREQALLLFLGLKIEPKLLSDKEILLAVSAKQLPELTSHLLNNNEYELSVLNEALVRAIKANSMENVRLLLEAGADANGYVDDSPVIGYLTKGKDLKAFLQISTYLFQYGAYVFEEPELEALFNSMVIEWVESVLVVDWIQSPSEAQKTRAAIFVLNKLIDPFNLFA